MPTFDTGYPLKYPLAFVNPLKGYLEVEQLEPELGRRLQIIDSDELDLIADSHTVICHSFSCIPVALACLTQTIQPKTVLWLEPENLLYNPHLVDETLKDSDRQLITRIRQSINKVSPEPHLRARWFDRLESNLTHFRECLKTHQVALNRPHFTSELACMDTKLVLGLSDYSQSQEWCEKRFHEFGLANFASIRWVTLRNCGFFSFEEHRGLPLLSALAQIVLWTES